MDLVVGTEFWMHRLQERRSRATATAESLQTTALVEEKIKSYAATERRLRQAESKVIVIVVVRLETGAESTAQNGFKLL